MNLEKPTYIVVLSSNENHSRHNCYGGRTYRHKGEIYGVLTSPDRAKLYRSVLAAQRMAKSLNNSTTQDGLWIVVKSTGGA